MANTQPVSELLKRATDAGDVPGVVVAAATADGPIFFANPPAGRWTLEAEYEGEKFSKTVDVNGRFYITLSIQFKGGGAQGN